MAKLSVNRALDDAQSLTRRGAHGEARALYQAILKEFPDNLPARKALKVLDRDHPAPLTVHPPRETLAGLAAGCGRGQFADVARDCAALIRAFPTSFVLWNIPGIALQGLGRRTQALDSFVRAADLNPAYPDARYNLGVLLQLGGKLDAAETAYRAAVALRPDYAEAMNNLGFVCLARGKVEKAVEWLRMALSCRPDFAEAQNNLGSALMRQGEAEAALGAFRRALELKPALVAAETNIGNLHLELGQYPQAVAAYERAIAIAPGHAEAQDQLGVALRLAGRPEEAIAAHRKAIALAPGHVDARYNLGLALKASGAPDAAIAALHEVLALAPDHAKAANSLGIALQNLGRIDEAVAAYRRALTIKPDFAECAYNLSRATRLEPTDSIVQQMEALLRDTRLAAAERSALGFALANVHDQRGETAVALGYLHEANAVKRRLLRYDPADDRQMFQDLARAAPTIERAATGIDPVPAEVTPIFILGMPRSGTTLIEQVISAHPLVTGGGELDFVARHGEDLALGRVPADPARLFQFRQDYLGHLRRLGGGRHVVTDKTPQNFLFLSLIAAALPEAKIVHVTRDPSATCWSNYWQNFASRRLGYAYDLADTVAYFGLYRQWMSDWSAHSPDRLIEVNYEALTQDPETQTRALIAGIGLPWSDACLAPQENRRAVRTASNLQVRHPIYQGSSLRWRAYAPLLGGVLDGLNQLGPAEPQG